MPRPVDTLLRLARRRPGRAALVLGAMALLAAGAGLASGPLRAAFHLRGAEQALERHDLASAQDHLARSLAAGPTKRARLLAACTARRLDACGDAERLLSEYEATHGETDEGRFEELLLGVQQGDQSESERDVFSRAEQATPDAALALEALAKGYMNTLRYSRAVEALDRLLARAPGHAPALVLRGRCLDGLRRVEPALADFRRAVELAPESADARLALADALGRTGHPGAAIDQYEAARTARPDDPAVLLGLARVLCDAAEPERARERLDELLAARPGHADGLVERGRLALRRGDAAAAERDLSRAAAAAPWHRDGHALLALALDELKRADDARLCREQQRELEARDAELGRLTLRQRRKPDNPAARFALARWMLDNGHNEMGVRWLLSIQRLDPRHGPTQAALAEHFERSGQPRRAARHRALASP